MNIEQMLIYDEGSRNKIYLDSEGYWTVGIGHLLAKKKITKQEAIAILDFQLNRKTQGVISNEELSNLLAIDLTSMMSTMKSQWYYPIYLKMDVARRRALQNMAFQMGAGVGGVGGFRNMLLALDKTPTPDYQGAHRHALDSLWYKQTPNRARRVAAVLKDGNFDSYK
ncbi:glycoside hydrolase family protein [Aeromonas salmonicida]|uniref:glycoside hydrolase family protein n=1 Tax=Aeromonas salmonicida TaxID=645 RepID=UPI00259FAB53|nr:glycoside hydrolase family protein [Aeromonas salmonicida]MDM5128644.1 glycoside hydrolase family protein [Aeromonas salmonicida]